MNEVLIMTTMHKTLNNVPSNTKQTAIELLNKALAALIDLSLITKQAHWNVKGPRFIMIHELLDQFRDNLDEHIDTIAERVVQLGGTALGTTQIVVKDTFLKPYLTDIYSVEDHLAALIERYGQTANFLRKAINETADAGEADAADIFTAASRSLDKNLWFLEAHIQETK